ncbi:MAG: histidinol dehydrogenase [Rickettsiales bacterium]|nr:histidinol dehydrogenase [Rickettsiales bacterium]
MIKNIKIKKLEDLYSYSLSRDNSNIDLVNYVADIVTDVRNNGSKALFKYTKKFDNLELNENNCFFTKSDFLNSYNKISANLRESLHFAYERIVSYNKKQFPDDYIYNDEYISELGWKYYPLNSVAMYVPGGLASYPSSLLMTATIAKIAGVKNIITVMPCPNGEYNDSVLAAAHIIGIDKIYKFGGAQIIAALAYGNNVIPKVDKIVGPGNAYVAEAKRQVYGKVGIDTIAGPSEILVIADESANPEYIAYDLLSQAEHDVNAASYLITDSELLANNVSDKIKEILPSLSRSDIAMSAINNNSFIFKVADLKTIGLEIANYIAPEHLELMTKDNDFFIANISSAGAIFIGDYSTEPIGDYIAGPSHVLPTSGAGRYSSGLSIFDFLKKTSIINVSKDTYNDFAVHAVNIAESEGLDCHARACLARIKSDK